MRIWPSKWREDRKDSHGKKHTWAFQRLLFWVQSINVFQSFCIMFMFGVRFENEEIFIHVLDRRDAVRKPSWEGLPGTKKEDFFGYTLNSGESFALQ